MVTELIEFAREEAILAREHEMRLMQILLGMQSYPQTQQQNFPVPRCICHSLALCTEKAFEKLHQILDTSLQKSRAKASGGWEHLSGSHLSEISLCCWKYLATFFFDICLICCWLGHGTLISYSLKSKTKNENKIRKLRIQLFFHSKLLC